MAVSRAGLWILVILFSVVFNAVWIALGMTVGSKVMSSVSLCGMGLYWILYYGGWLPIASRRHERGSGEFRIPMLPTSRREGLAGGCAFLAMGGLILLPERLSWLAIPLSPLILLGFVLGGWVPLARLVRSKWKGGLRREH